MREGKKTTHRKLSEKINVFGDFVFSPLSLSLIRHHHYHAPPTIYFIFLLCFGCHVFMHCFMFVVSNFPHQTHRATWLSIVLLLSFALLHDLMSISLSIKLIKCWIMCVFDGKFGSQTANTQIYLIPFFLNWQWERFSQNAFSRCKLYLNFDLWIVEN